MKKIRKMFCIAAVLTFLFGCQNPQEDVLVVTPTETVSPTIEVPEADAPEETVSPTEKPIFAEDQEPTAERMVTATPEPTATVTPTPTEMPVHVHIWTVKVNSATCTTDGMTVEVCECGEQQNATSVLAIGHNLEKKVTKEATVEEEGSWEDVCTVCGEVTATGNIEKLIPTATPIPTVTPVQTNTPTSTPSPTPTPRPDPFEEYTWFNVGYEMLRYTDDTCTEIEIIDVSDYFDVDLSKSGNIEVGLSNHSDEKGDLQTTFHLYDYPSHDANILKTIDTSDNPYFGFFASKRCIETGWYYVRWSVRIPGTYDYAQYYGFMDDEYIKPKNDNNFAKQNCQFELPLYEPWDFPEDIEDFTLQVGEEKDIVYGLTYMETTDYDFTVYYAVENYSERPKFFTVITIEDINIVEVHCKKFKASGTFMTFLPDLYYKEGLGYFLDDGTRYMDFLGVSPGSTEVTLTCYHLLEWDNNDFVNPIFTMGDVVASTTFTVTVTE